jgi:hypothetical protein
MNRIINTGMIYRGIFWFIVISFTFFTFCCTDNGNSEPSAEKNGMEKKIATQDTIKIGGPITCVQSHERKMKSSDEHFKYIVTIQGTVAKIESPDIFITVKKVSVQNLKKENSTWIKDQSVVKRPPYADGNTYAFRAKHEVIDNVVSTGVYEISFSQP